MKITSIVAVLTGAGLCVGLVSAAWGAGEKAEKPVVKPGQAVISGKADVLDGDTIRIKGKPVQLYGVDAPEMTDPRGPVSRAALIDIIGVRELVCTVRTTNKDKTPLAVCRVGPIDLGKALIGMGRAYANTLYIADYVAAERKARAAGRGFWENIEILDALKIPIWLKESLSLAMGAMLAVVGGMLLSWVSENRNAKRNKLLVMHGLHQELKTIKSVLDIVVVHPAFDFAPGFAHLESLSNRYHAAGMDIAYLKADLSKKINFAYSKFTITIALAKKQKILGDSAGFAATKAAIDAAVLALAAELGIPA